MKFRADLSISLLILSTLTITVSVVVLVVNLSKELFLGWQAQLGSVVATTASQMDGNLLKQIQTKEDMGSSAYDQILQMLRKARNVNRRDDFYIRYFYTERPNPKNAKELIFLVDAEEDPNDILQVGDLDIGGMESFVLDHLEEVYSSNTIVKDQWGEWIVASAPVYDSEQKYAGTVGAVISAEILESLPKKLILIALPYLAISLVTAGLIAHFLSKKISQSLGLIYDATKEIQKGNLKCRIDLETKDEFGSVGRAIHEMTKNLAQENLFKTEVSQYLAKPIVDQISDPKQSIKVEGERRRVTVLVTDIRGFTSFAEQTDPEIVVSLLNEYFSVMFTIIEKHGGVIDKLIGDAIVVEFGIIDPVNQEEKAVQTALEMQTALLGLQEKWKKENLPPLKSGVGIHTGDAVVGTIGSKNQKLEYTAVGDTVNTATSLEQYTKQTKYPILISEATFEKVRSAFEVATLGEISLPGKSNPINTYAILISKSSI